MSESLLFQIPIKNVKGKSFRILVFNFFSFSFSCSCSFSAVALVLLLGLADCVSCDSHSVDSVPLGFEISGFDCDFGGDHGGKGQSLVSANGVFEFGFLERDGGEFVVGVRYNLGPKSANLPVWTLGGGVRVSINSTFRLSMDGRLILLENPSNSIVWSSDTSNLGVETATLLSNGNLVLMGSGNKVIWESFDRPTNTLLPGQSLRFPHNLRALSTRSTSSYYTLVIHESGVLELMWESNVTYWRTHLTSSETVKELRFQSNGVLGLFDDTNKTVWSVSSKDFDETSVSLRHLRIDKDGNLRIYSWDVGERVWRVGWQAVEDQCDVFGSCGLYSVCGYNKTGPVCDCLYSDSFDWGQNGIRQPDSGGPECKKMVDIANCKSHTSMLVIKKTVLYGLYPPHDVDMMLSEESCKEYCANDTTCVASTAKNDGSGLCTLKRTGFVSGSAAPSIPSTSFLKVCLVPQAVKNPNLAPQLMSFPFSLSYKRVVSAIAFVVFVTLSVMLGLEMFVFLFVYRRRRRQNENDARKGTIPFGKGVPEYSALTRLSYEEVQELTSGFSTQLGLSVFKGLLPPEMAVVAKVIRETVVPEKEFLKAVAVLGGTHHRNLAALHGFCFDPDHKILIYEYIPNGSLEKWLFDEPRDWRKRLDVAIGVTRALAYLHTGCQNCITHGNLKLENVMLDENLVPRLTDFGVQTFLLARTTSSQGPSSEEDVYMLGRLVLEMAVCGRDVGAEGLDRVMERVNREQRGLGDEGLRGVERAVRIALWCMQTQPFLRPSVGEVMKVLEGTLSVDRPPTAAARNDDVLGGDGAVIELES